MYIHQASVWGVRIQDGFIITGSMDGTIAVIDIKTLGTKKHFKAHENEWGSEYYLGEILKFEINLGFNTLVSDLDTSSDVIVSGCFDRILKVWSFPDCQLLRTIDAKHVVNCVSVYKGIKSFSMKR